MSWPRLCPVRLFRSWRFRRRLHRRHDQPLARGKRSGVRAFCRGPQSWSAPRWGGGSRFFCRAKSPAPGRQATLAGLVLIAPAPDFTEQLMWKRFSASSRGDPGQGSLEATVGLWRRSALSDHARADRGGPQPSVARRPHRSRMSGSHPAGRPGSRRAVAARLALAHRLPRRRGADHDPGRRPPPVAPAGHRADHCCRGGDLSQPSPFEAHNPAAQLRRRAHLRVTATNPSS